MARELRWGGGGRAGCYGYNFFRKCSPLLRVHLRIKISILGRKIECGWGQGGGQREFESRVRK